jgi:hypothetical protein
MNTIINEKQEVYLEYGTQFRHALSTIHDNLTKFTHGQCLGSLAYRPESGQVNLETFVGTSIQTCVSTRTLIVIKAYYQSLIVIISNSLRHETLRSHSGVA